MQIEKIGAVGAKKAMNIRSPLVNTEIERLKVLTTDWYHVAAGLACSKIHRQEIKLSLGQGWRGRVDGQDCTLLPVRTNLSDARLAVINDNHAMMFETDGKNAVLDKKSEIDSQSIRDLMAFSELVMTPQALHMMLGQTGIDPSKVNVSPFSHVTLDGQMIARWIVVAPGTTLMLVSTPKGSVLRQIGLRTIEVARVTFDEAKQHHDWATRIGASQRVA